MRTKILVVDNNAADPLSQPLYKRLSEEFRLRVLVPVHWFDNYTSIHAEHCGSADNFEVIPLRTFFTSRAHRLLYAGVLRQLREFQPDMVFVNSEPENFQTLEFALLNRWATNAPLIFGTWRNIDHSDGKYAYRFSFLHARVERTVLRFAEHGVAFTEDAVEIFRRLGFDAMTFIPPPVDMSVFAPSQEEHRGRPFTVGYAGRLHPLKGVDVLIEALSLLSPDIHLLVAGDGPELGALRRRSSILGLGEHIDWRGAVPRSQMPFLMQEMDVLVLPSRTGRYWKEQFGRVIIEAMACGVPVIGSDSGAIPAVIGDAGLVVHEGDAVGLSGAIRRMKEDPAFRLECRRKGMARVAGEHEISSVASRFKDLFRSLAVRPSFH